MYILQQKHTVIYFIGLGRGGQSRVMSMIALIFAKVVRKLRKIVKFAIPRKEDKREGKRAPTKLRKLRKLRKLVKLVIAREGGRETRQKGTDQNCEKYENCENCRNYENCEK